MGFFLGLNPTWHVRGKGPTFHLQGKSSTPSFFVLTKTELLRCGDVEVLGEIRAQPSGAVTKKYEPFPGNNLLYLIRKEIIILK